MYWFLQSPAVKYVLNTRGITFMAFYERVLIKSMMIYDDTNTFKKSILSKDPSIKWFLKV